MSQHVFQRAGVLAATVGVAGLLGAGVASAHVTANVYGPQPTKGGYAAIVFRVPSEEKDPVTTTKVAVDFKADYGIGSVRTKPVPGWTAQVTKSKLPTPIKKDNGTEITEAVTAVTWTAQAGSELKATDYQEFSVSFGPLPTNVDEVEFPAHQTYSDGKVVDWNQPTPAGGEEPEHPAPAVKLAAKAEDGDAHGNMANTASTTGEQSQASAASDNTARWLGGAGLLVGAIGLGVGAGATIRARKATAKSGGNS
ncbi:YcnI family protein [Amycolatopsis sp. OK19-0408]|uniref:YcnI family protein n=1 Tax=Amycolatopsis iheyensis TaxID=2945988 RepID=A0A9X2SMS6_9PSEU|nr:YcnI family protein [Amycolatopsis iheyensis]MCR6486236.1 YcnI family protein [Amycolatopsis iheyensis]